MYLIPFGLTQRMKKQVAFDRGNDILEDMRTAPSDLPVNELLQLIRPLGSVSIGAC